MVYQHEKDLLNTTTDTTCKQFFGEEDLGKAIKEFCIEDRQRNEVFLSQYEELCARDMGYHDNRFSLDQIQGES